MANNAKNVSVGKPRTTGAIYIAPAGTVLPTDATTALAAAYKHLGYVSDDGLSNSPSIESDDIKAWGGDTVLSPQTSKSEDFSFTLIESLNMEVMKTVYGAENISGTFETGLTATYSSNELPAAVWVVEMILNNDILKRTVIPAGKITEIGEISYKDNEAIGYEITLKALPSNEIDNAMHKDFYKKNSSK